MEVIEEDEVGGDRAGAHRGRRWVVMTLCRNQRVVMPRKKDLDLLSTAPEQSYRNVPETSIRWDDARDDDR